MTEVFCGDLCRAKVFFMYVVVYFSCQNCITTDLSIEKYILELRGVTMPKI